jgi:hypothetical protein
MEPSVISALLWHFGIATKLLIVVALLRRGRFRAVPLFLAYGLALLLRSVVLWASAKLEHYPLYFYSYWVGQAVLVALGLAVVWEVYSDAFRRFPSVHRWTSAVFGTATVCLLIMCIASVLAAPATAAFPLGATLLLAERSAWILQVGLVLLLVSVAVFGGMSLRTLTFGIALGLGVHSVISLAVVTYLSMGDGQSASMHVIPQQLGFLLAGAVWLAFLLKVKEAAPAALLPGTTPEWTPGDLLHE